MSSRNFHQDFMLLNRNHLGGGGSSFSVLASVNTPFSTSRTVLASDNTPYNVPRAVLASDGTPYNAI